jgi:hypothetical protein
MDDYFFVFKHFDGRHIDTDSMIGGMDEPIYANLIKPLSPFRLKIGTDSICVTTVLSSQRSWFMF